MSLTESITEIGKKLSIRESQLDTILMESRKVVRFCSNAIKAMHAHDMETALTNLDEAEKLLGKISADREEFPAQLNHVYQEYSEARIVLFAIKSKKLPGCSELNVPEIPYLLGLLDAVGELKREMYESLRHGNKKDAETFFSLMEEIYDELLPLRFSNSVLPEFRHKQDAARHQIEQARGELL